MQRFRGGLVFKAHRLCVSLNSRLESNKEEKKKDAVRVWVQGSGFEVDIFAQELEFRVTNVTIERRII